MTPRMKKLVGLLILIPGLTIYMFLAAALGEKTPARWFIQVPYYLVAGILWALPVRSLIIWMNQPRNDADET